jgi:hypothetical protein
MKKAAVRQPHFKTQIYLQHIVPEMLTEVKRKEMLWVGYPRDACCPARRIVSEYAVVWAQSTAGGMCGSLCGNFRRSCSSVS